MWDRARASATAGLDRMHRRHLTGTAGGAASYEAPSADKPASEAPMPMSMSWTTISTSTSSSTFYQTTVDGPANALGIDIVANAAATSHRPLRPRRLPQLDAHSARVASALHTGMYVWLLFVCSPSSTYSMYTHTAGVAMAASCTALVLCILRWNHLLLRHSPMFIICPPSQSTYRCACRGHSLQQMRVKQGRTEEKQGAVLFCIGHFIFP